MTTTTKDKTTTEPVGDTGAKRSSQMPGNPRGILRQIMDDTPLFERAKDREQVIYGKMKAKLNEGDKINLDRYPLLLAMFEYWFTNEYRNLTPRSKPELRSTDDKESSDDSVPSDDAEPTPTDKREEEARQKAEDVTKIKESIKTAVKKIIRLDTILPNGKPLRECSTEEIAEFGGTLTKIAAKMKPGQIAGDVFKDDDLKAIQQ